MPETPQGVWSKQMATNHQESKMTIIEALDNALELLEVEGFTSGDIYDDLKLAISRIRSKYPKAAEDEI